MNALPVITRPSRDLIDAAIALHGPLRVLLAAIRALLRPRARPPDNLGRVPDYLRADIGLAPLAYAPHWSQHLN